VGEVLEFIEKTGMDVVRMIRIEDHPSKLKLVRVGPSKLKLVRVKHPSKPLDSTAEDALTAQRQTP
jgi:hypothetical protein